MTSTNKHTVKVNGHNTSVFIENEFWDELKKICLIRSVTADELISEIDKEKKTTNLSRAIRLYILNHLRDN